MSLLDKPDGQTCSRCNKRPATAWWTDEGIVAAVHGMFTPRCERCCIEAQLEHAKRLAASIPELEAKLAALEQWEKQFGGG